MGVTQSAHERPLSRGTFGVAQVVKPRVVGGGSSVVSALSAPVDADADVPAPPDTGAAAAKAVTPAAPSVPVVHKLHAPGCDLVHGGGAERRDVSGAATAASPAPKGATRDPETPTADSQAASKLACSCDADPDRSATILIESKTAGKESSVEEQDVQRTAAVVAAGAVATVGGQVRAGRHPADVTIPDDSMRRQHLLCSARDRTTVHVRALAKTYHLIGQGRFSAGLHKLVLHQVVKMGACSVQVTELCLDDASPDVAPAAGEEAPCGSGGDVHVGAGDGEGDGAGAGAGAGAETAAADGAGCASDAAVAAAAGSAPAPPVPAKRVCYICWEDSTGEGTSELVASPCVCNNHVHRKCLLTWLESRAMRECPVCKTTLPCGAVVPPPYIVLRVVRHMRNHVWTGRKEFVIGFAGRESNAITIGSSDRCDVPLPDPSVSRSHARVSLRDGEFYVEDLSSSGGTYLRLMTSSTLSLTRPVTLKAGRSTLALRVAPVPASPTDDKAAVSRSASRAVTASTAPVGAAPPVPPASRTTPRHRVVYRSAQSGAAVDVDGGEAHGSAEAEGVGSQAADVPPAGRASKTRFARLWALRKSSSK